MAANSVSLDDAPSGGGRAEAGGDGTRVPANPRVVASLVVGLAALSFALLSPAHAVVASIAIAALVALPAAGIERGAVPIAVILIAAAALLLAQLVLFGSDALSCLVAGLAAAAAMAAPRLVSRDAVGVGDVELACLLGFALGWDAFVALAIAFVCAFPFAVVALVRGGVAARGETLPFAAFMAVGGIIVIFAGPISG
jgi:leader peptidase (prepilin peptidase)/N-methyltransferase